MDNVELLNKKIIPLCFCVDISKSTSVIVDSTGAIKTGRKINIEGREMDEVRGGKTLFDIMIERMNSFVSSLLADKRISSTAFIKFTAFAEEATATELQRVKSNMVENFKHDVVCNLFKKYKDVNSSKIARGIDVSLSDLSIDLEKCNFDYENPRVIIFTDGIISDPERLPSIKETISECFKKTPYIYIVVLNDDYEELKKLAKEIDAELIPSNSEDLSSFLNFIHDNVSYRPNVKGQYSARDTFRLGGDVR